MERYAHGAQAGGHTLAAALAALPANAQPTTLLLGVIVAVALLCGALLFLRGGGSSREQPLLASEGMVSTSLRGYALALLDAHRFTEAEEAVLACLARAPDTRFKGLHGALLSLRGEHAAALAELEGASRMLAGAGAAVPPRHAPYAAHLLAGQSLALEALGRGDAATARMREAAALDPAVVQTRTASMRLIADAAREQELERLAFERLSEWEQDRPVPRAFGFSDAGEGVRFYRKALATHKNDPHLLGDLAQALHASGDHRGSERIFEHALQAAPHDPWVRYDYATMRWRLGQMADAQRELAEAVRLAPHSAAIRGAYALFLLRTDQAPRAEQETLAAMAVRSDVWILPRLHGGILRAQNKLPQAVRAFQEAERLGATDAAFRLLFASVLEQVDQAQAAESQYRSALRSDGTEGIAPARYGAFLFRQLRLGEAEEQLVRAARWPEGADAHVTLVALYLLEGRLDDAGRHLQAALQSSAQPALLQEYQAEWLLRRGQAADAYALAQQVKEQGVTRGSLNLVIGGALLALGRTFEAQSALREAVRLEPALPALLLGRARTLRDLGYTSAALETVNQALTVAPNWPEALAAQQQLTAEQTATSPERTRNPRRRRG
ncbi:MAG TPA: tetratricopeptide repeat protein [Ktedonobacterales bacterium]|nr:tetratricopeptide repeat protein [Ktedonobacterales bacterium]